MNNEPAASNKLTAATNGTRGLGPTKESLRERICEVTVAECMRKLGGQLRAIVLIGSLARDEASFARLGDGWELRGDAEFLVVMKERCKRPSSDECDRIRSAIGENLAQVGLRGNVEVGFLLPFFFSRLPAHIFTYELKHRGKVVWGDTKILEEVPDFRAAQVSREDAWRLLSNRLVEIMSCAPEMTNASQLLSPGLQYRLVKLHLDAATSISVFLGLYEPSYLGRMNALACLESKHSAQKLPFDIHELNQYFERCTTAKLSFPANFERCSEIEWRPSLQAALAIWRWMLAELSGASRTLTGDELFEKHRRMQPYHERFRGWLYVARARGWHRSVGLWPHWLGMCWKMSPRYWIYSVAARTLEQVTKSKTELDGAETAAFFELVRRKLPVVAGAFYKEERPEFLALAAEVVWNYKQFVAGTRA